MEAALTSALFGHCKSVDKARRHNNFASTILQMAYGHGFGMHRMRPLFLICYGYDRAKFACELCEAAP